MNVSSVWFDIIYVFFGNKSHLLHIPVYQNMIRGSNESFGCIKR